MNAVSLPQDNEVYEAILVEPHSPKSGPSLGCIIGMILGSLFFLMIVGLTVMVSIFSPGVFSPPNPITLEQDAAETREFLATEGVSQALRGGHVTTHPDFDKIDKFVQSMVEISDDTANKKMQKMIDHRRHWEETAKRSTDYFHYGELTRVDMQDLIDNLSGPSPFNTGQYEIVRIDKIASGEYRVALSYDYGYGHESMFIWWLSEVNGRLLIYDWLNTELGTRESFEYGAICDLTITESARHDKHLAAEVAYFAIDENLEYEVYQEQIRKCLRDTESYSGAKSLKGHYELLAAMRWKYHGELREAIRVLDKILSPDSTPGVHLLRAEIEFENGLYDDAVSNYEKFIQTAGSSPHVERQLIQCARMMSDVAEEKRLLAAYCEHVSLARVLHLGNLVELNSDAENKALFEKIDSTDDKASIYTSLANRMKYLRFYQHQFDLLKSHMKTSMPDSALARFAELSAASDTEAFVKALEWVDSLEPEKAAKYRYDFWYAVPDKKILDVFKSADNKESHFEEIADYYRYEDYYPEDMREICELTLEENTESQAANRTLAQLLIGDKDYDGAIEKLNAAAKAMKEDEDKTSFNYSMLRALYQGGKSKKAIAWAVKHELVDSLLNLKIAKDDFAQFEQLLGKIDKKTDNYEYYQALLKNNRGDTDAAVNDLVAMIKEAESDDTKEVDYRAQSQLKEILKENGQPLKFVELLPAEERFWELGNELLEANDWKRCDRLMQLEEPSLADAQRAFGLMVDWEQGKCEMLAAMKKGLDDLPRSPSNLDRVNDFLINASIRAGDFENAETWAKTIKSAQARSRALAGIFIKEGDWKQAVKRLREIAENERIYLPTDQYAWDNVAYEQPEIAALIPPRSAYSIGQDADLNFELLFEADPSLDADSLTQQFTASLGEEFKTDTQNASWLSFTNGNGDLTIVIHQTSPRYEKSSYGYYAADESAELQQLFLKTRSRLDVSVYSKLPLSGADSVRIFDAVAKPLCDLEPQLFGSSSMWLMPDKFDAWFAAKSKNESNLDAGEDCQGQRAFFTQDAKIDHQARQAFTIELVSVLKDYLESSDREKSLVVQLSSSEQYVVDVDRIQRGSYSTNIIGTARYADDVPRVGNLAGEVSFTVSQVKSFDAKFDQTNLQRSLKSSDQ